MKKSWILGLIILTSACAKDFIPVNFQIEGAKNAVIVRIDGEHTVPVSYTHLTLPTILRV